MEEPQIFFGVCGYEYKLKKSTKDTLDNYAETHCEPGSFLKSVLSNDLMSSLSKADVDNRATLDKICLYVMHEIPSECWGTPVIVNNWLNKKHDFKKDE